MARVIRALKPAWVLAENTAGAIHLVLDRALADLEEAGYSWAAVVLPALAVAAWHERQRLFIMAHLDGERRPPEGDGGQSRLAYIAGTAQPFRQGTDRRMARSASDPEGGRREGGEVSTRSRPEGERAADVVRDSADATEPGSTQLCGGEAETESAWRNEPCARQWWEAERGLVRVVHGLPRWLDRHRRRRVAALGDSCVPAQVYPILAAIAEVEEVRAARVSAEAEE
jgi:site-specific DNA-cytosine methylase